jgi:hypothetical protein
MIFLGIILSIAAIGFFCWLLFTLAVFALPFFAGLTAGGWAYHTGAGWMGAILIGVVAAGLTLGLGQLLLGIVRPLWARLLIALAFVAPAATRRLPRHARHREAHHAVGDLAVGVFRHRRGRGRRHRVRARHGHGGRWPGRPEPRRA